MSYIGNQPTQTGAPTGSIADLSVTTPKLNNGAATLAKLDTTGAAGQVLTANGVGVAPSWQTPTSAGVPAGSMVAFAGATAPTGWLLCHGQAVSTTTYAALFAAIGYAYGGSGASFNLPDARGRSIFGVDNMGGTAANRITTAGSGIAGSTRGAAGGSETQALTTAQLPAHQHFVASTITTATGGLTATNTLTQTAGLGGNSSYDLVGSTTAATLGLSSSVGTGAAHNNMPPALIASYIIKT